MTAGVTVFCTLKLPMKCKAYLTKKMKTTKTNHITTIQTSKFKTTLIKVSFTAPLSHDTLTKRVLLSHVLRNSSKEFSSKKVLNIHLEDLYGANLSVSAKKQGQIHTVNFYIQVANEKFLKSAPPLFEAALTTLGEVIMNPKVDHDGFCPEIVDLERRLLKEDIEAIYDDKTTYAIRQLQQKMCATEKFGVCGDGCLIELAKITPNTLFTTYQNMINDDEVAITIIGDLEHEKVIKLINSNFKLGIDMRTKFDAVDKEEKVVHGVDNFAEQQQINQAKLNIGYRTGVRIGDDDYFHALIFNGVFGGGSTSKLFVNVREKASLCYYVGSILDNYKGLMYVYSGLDLAQVPKAIAIIDKQLEDICSGNVTEQELQLAKNSYINAKRSALDSASGMIADFETELILGVTTDQFIEKLQAVTIEQIQAVAQKIKKDTIFTLEPGKQ